MGIKGRILLNTKSLAQHYCQVLCANIALLKYATDFEDEFSQEAAKTVKNIFYVDDCLKSTTDKDTTITVFAELRSMLAKGGFQLTK